MIALQHQVMIRDYLRDYGRLIHIEAERLEILRETDEAMFRKAMMIMDLADLVDHRVMDKKREQPID